MDRIDRADYESQDPANFQAVHKTLTGRCAFASTEYDAGERITLCALGKGTKQCFYVDQPKCADFKR